MGKVKNQRHRMVISGGFAQGAPASRISSLMNLGSGGVDLSSLEANLGSIHENKRVQACQLISDICKLNGHSSKVMEKVSNKKILNKFNLLLVDHSIRVKHAAFISLQTLSSIGNGDVINRLISSGIFRTALTIAAELVDESILDLLDIKQNALYTVANIISSQPTSVHEIIQHNMPFLEFLLSNISAEKHLSILNTCLNVLNIFSRASDDATLINQILGHRAVSLVQQLMNNLLSGKIVVDEATNTVLVTASEITIADQDMWIVVVQCLEILSNLYVNVAASIELQQTIDIRNIVTIAVQFLGLAAVGIRAGDSSVESRENDFIEMMSEFFTNLSTKVTAYIHGLEDEHGNFRAPADRSLYIRLLYVGTLLTTTRTPTYDMVTAFTAVWQQLQSKLQGQMMNSDTYAQLQAAQRLTDAEDDDVIVPDDADPDMAVTNPATASAAARTMSSNLMGAQFILSHKAVATVQTLEKALSALGDLLALQTSLVMVPSDIPSIPSSPCMSWEALSAYALFLQEALQNTTPSMDGSSGKAVEGWMTVEEEDLLTLKSSIITQCVTFFDVMTALVSHSALVCPVPQCIWIISEEQLRNLVVLLLQWLSTPQLEVCLSVLATIASFAKEHWCGASTFPTALFAVINNALLNRLRQPTAFSTSSIREGGGSSAPQVSLNKMQNVERATILLVDAVYNSLIDLHSNDHRIYHDVFARMSMRSVFSEERDKLVRRVQNNIFLLSESEREQVEDTLANIDGLLDYKRTNFR